MLNSLLPANSPALGAFALRVALGVMFLAHGLLKLAVFGIAGTVGFFESIGLPAALAYFTIGAEVIGGVLLIVGLQTRLVALVLLPVMLGATWVHAGNGWLFSAPNGGWEYPAFLVVAMIAQILIGSGAFALDGARGERLVGQPAE
jgi:putative oxidoreductase